MSNCPQINNTTIIGTSAVTYDSTPLPCTNVTTCDGLNDILSKFDAVICDVKASVDILTEEIIDITEDIMIITEDIININSQLEICCPNCNFSGTANQILNCNFTGTADQLPDPTTTTTSTSSSTTTTSTSSTTTTTSTTLLPAPTLENNGQTIFVGANPNQCDPEFYPYTLINNAMPKPSGFAYAIAPLGSYTWDQIEYVEIVNVFPSTEVSIQYNGLPVAPGMQLVPINIVTWEHDMLITRTTFDCTEASQIWIVRIKLYGYDISNSAQHTITYSETLCPNCTSSTTTTTTTIFCDCYVYEVTITAQDLLDSDNATVYVYVDEVCFLTDNQYTFQYNKEGIETICVSRTNSFFEQYIEVDGGYSLTSSQPVKLNQCCLAPMFISTESKETSSPVICDYELTITLYIKTVGLNKYAYVNPEGTVPFNGLNKWWHIQILGDASGYVEIRGDGRITYPITYC